jgi:uncharacterized protein YheU (UPF0270 family)
MAAFLLSSTHHLSNFSQSRLMPRDKEYDRKEQSEEGIEIPFQQIDPDTLRRMIQEFVTRDGADWAETGGSLEEKVAQVLRQLQNKQIKVVFDLTSQTANLVETR